MSYAYPVGVPQQAVPMHYAPAMGQGPQVQVQQMQHFPPVQQQQMMQPKRSNIARFIPFVIAALFLVIGLVVYQIDFDLPLWNVYSVDAKGAGITAATYAVDHRNSRFYASAGFLGISTEMFCLDDRVSTKAFGICVGVSATCQNFIDALVPEIPYEAVRTTEKKSVPGMFGERKCVVYEYGSDTWCAINGQIFQRCKGNACIDFENHKRLFSSSMFTCK
ncbi:hypothetical protein RCL1_005984 [Eukaryota sp. TZLM3-RCL]